MPDEGVMHFFHDWVHGHFLSCCKMNLKLVDMEGQTDLKQK